MSRKRRRRSINASTTARIVILASCAGMTAAVSVWKISPARAKALPIPVQNLVLAGNREAHMDDNGLQGLVISIAIGVAILAACGVVTFVMLILGIIAV